MKFSIVHPTARVTPEFVNPWWKAMYSARDSAGCTNDVEYIVVVHVSRLSDFWRVMQEHVNMAFNRTQWGRFQVVTNFGRDCLVDQCNAGQLAAQGEIILDNQDDMRYPEHWDTEISKLIPDTSQAICIQARTDGARKDLLTIPGIQTRALMRKIGQHCTPGYDGMFADDEWSAKAWLLADDVRKSSLYFEHLHPVNKTSEMDSVYVQENREQAYRTGWEVFQRRKAAGFPRIPFPDEITPAESPNVVQKALGWIADKLAPAESAPAPSENVIAICTPGESFPFRWVEAFLNLGSRFAQEKYICKRYMGHSSNVYHTRQDLCEKVIADARISGVVPKLVLWIDSDNILLPDQLSGLLRFMDHYPEVDAIFGWCWIRKDHGWTTSAGYFWEEDGVHLMSMNANALFAGRTSKEKWAPKSIQHSGFPTALIRYAALEKLGSGAFRPMTKADLPAFFEGNMPAKEVTDDWFSGEDSSWCLHAKKAGMTLVVDPGCKVTHLKLQGQEPDTKAMVAMGFNEGDMQERQAKINGAPIEVPPEYERVIS